MNVHFKRLMRERKRELDIIINLLMNLLISVQQPGDESQLLDS